ncbi:unnamed protein product [Somion occarium]|uniref:Uncharacterized protein n=1 Tax=Somion occarium TaxID=3059160 RepID=A0ABP1D5F4_9APHY
MPAYVPVFPLVDLTVQLQSTPSTSSVDSGHELPALRLSYTEQLSRAHEQLASLPTELCPPSCPPSPHFESHAELIRERILEAINVSGGESSNPKWGHVTRLVRMGCTSRGYRGAAPGVRVGSTSAVEVHGYQWTLPETEEEWKECEKRWKKCSRVIVGKDREMISKYWPQDAAPRPNLSQAMANGEQTKSKSQRVREKVESWQAKLIHLVDETPSQTPPLDVVPEPNGQKEVTLEAPKQSSLEFPVVKRLVGHGMKPRPEHVVPSIDPKLPTASPMDVEISSPAADAAKPPDQLASEPMAEQKAAGISDIPEMSFLPPSFPTYLQTSTPHESRLKAKPPASREKPPPIYPRLFLSSSPGSPPFTRSSEFDPAQPRRKLNVLVAPFSSSPTLSLRNAQKRQRPLTPRDEDDDPFISRPNVPPSKKQKLDEHPEPDPVLDHAPISSAPLPPSTPPLPPATPPLSRSKTPSPRTQSKDLGNARGLPIPSTPDRKALPTLTELLASSRRSRPRPRPPSRKLKSAPSTPSRHGPRITKPFAVADRDDVEEEEKDVLPMIIENPRSPSPVRTYFSSPASGSSESTPQSIRQKRLGSPVSPLASPALKMGRFVPAFVSTQKFGGPVFGAGIESQTQTGLVPPAAGGFMGFNSQFDVDGRIDQVSEFLERDVDFDGWLRDIPEVEAEMESQSQGKPPLGHSQGEVGVQ